MLKSILICALFGTYMVNNIMQYKLLLSRRSEDVVSGHKEFIEMFTHILGILTVITFPP